MTKPIYANEQHKQIIKHYLTICDDFVKEVSTPTKYKTYNEVLNTIIQYHNNYGKGAKENNYWDWLMIIPINVTVMAQGYFAGIETKSKRAVINAYKVVLQEILEQTVDKIENLEPVIDE